MKDFFITTPIYYANAQPHLGHAYTTITADVLKRLWQQQGQKAFLLVGTDEHGLKIQKKAEVARETPQQFVNKVTCKFKKTWERLGIGYDYFIRTTNKRHQAAVQRVLEELYQRGAVYKGQYEGLYCVGCEQFKQKSDLVNGKCPDHNLIPEKLKEESYLLKMGEKQVELLEKIKKDEFKIRPEKYRREIISFLEKQTLKDISISRRKVAWGIPLPFDQEYTTYVWVDAFLSYLTGLGWKGDPERIPSQWPAEAQLIGKDILRVHATIWPIILMHLKLPLPSLYVHGLIISGGRKMSKTLGNVIHINDMLDNFGLEGTRYLLLTAGTFGEDMDLTMERMVKKYNADLANGLGNLVSRVIKLGQRAEIRNEVWRAEINKVPEWKEQADTTIQLDKMLKQLWRELIHNNDKLLEKVKPWEVIKYDEEEFNRFMNERWADLAKISRQLKPFLPEAAEKIKCALETKQTEPLFQRIQV